MQLLRSFLFFTLFAWTLTARAGLDYRVDIDAAQAFQALLNENLSLVIDRGDPDLDEPQLAALLREAPAQAQALMETAGYFSSRATLSVVDAASRHYRLHIEPGDPVRVERIDIVVNGPLALAPEFAQRRQEIVDAWPLALGQPYRQADWDNGKRQSLRLLQRDGYPLATLTASRADIDPQTQRANLSVELDSGPEVAFGDLEIHGLSRYPPAVVSGMADFHPGERYRLQKLLDYQTALEQSAYFSSARVQADVERRVNGRVPVVVDLTEYPHQKLEFGITYDTEEGVGTRIGYDNYTLFGQGYTSSVLWDWKHNSETLTLGLGLPRTGDGYSHALSTALSRSDIQGLWTESLTVGAWRIRTRGDIEARYGVEYVSEQQRPAGGELAVTHALLPTVGWTQRKVDDPLRPRSGTLLDASVAVTAGGAISSTSFTRAYGRAAVYWTPFTRWGTWVGRLELGQVWAVDSSRVPQAELFRTGGSGSVRGYDYQGLGVSNSSGTVLGGTVLAVFSVEYQYPIRPDWALAVFHDAGNATASWNTFALQRSNGVGLRWMSPVAPLAFDVAKGEGGGRRIVWHMSLGLAF
ncbi:autotransporter assembly complex protein TamA [Paludibacterium yongneupense]|uniref:autotransporter assembly complex protein TamA n=1 Tax=Paludibacterium yongneupense TaxID=400061 RepID=UPI0003F9DD17|nr:autotransporter assembly complex family protein [Paludibacterium yongneupense]